MGKKRPQSIGVMVKEGKWVRWGDVQVRQKVCVSTYNTNEMGEMTGVEKEKAKIPVITKLLHLRNIKRCTALSFSPLRFPSSAPPLFLSSAGVLPGGRAMGL